MRRVRTIEAEEMSLQPFNHRGAPERVPFGVALWKLETPCVGCHVTHLASERSNLRHSQAHLAGFRRCCCLDPLVLVVTSFFGMLGVLLGLIGGQQKPAVKVSILELLT